MTLRRALPILLIGLLVFAARGGALAQDTGPGVGAALPGTGFTYQGHLVDGGGPVDEACDIQFSLHDALSGGAQLGSTQTLTSTTVTDGRFTVILNAAGQFGPRAFDGSARWLGIAVRCPAGGGGYTNLVPRQPLTAAPLALALPGLRTEQNASSPNVVGGHISNTVSGGVVGAFIGGGGMLGQPNSAGENWTTVSGGAGNAANDEFATVGGGENNLADDQHATVGGGEGNTAEELHATVSGGQNNTASEEHATVSGGEDNSAGGMAATVPGGTSNTANGTNSFAAGQSARALHGGAFVWADNTGAPITSTASNQFVVRASSGVTMYTNASATTGVRVFPGGGSWTSVSDRNAKANFAPVDGVAILNTLAGLPIETWNYTAQDDSIRHLGPMAQDFYAAFGLGETDTGISTVDADGVALAAIQGLYSVVQAKDAALAEQSATIVALTERVRALETTVETFRRNVSTTGEAASSGKPAHRAVSTDTIQLALVLVAGLLAGAGIAAGAFALGRRGGR